jgi:hypothetical protein
MAKQTKDAQAQQPNIRFVGKKTEVNGKEIVPVPPKEINNGMKHYELPDAETQTAGFYHEDAAKIVRLFPQFYKMLLPKG